MAQANKWTIRIGNGPSSNRMAEGLEARRNTPEWSMIAAKLSPFSLLPPAPEPLRSVQNQAAVPGR